MARPRKTPQRVHADLTKTAEIEKRRQTVAANILAGATFEDIAASLGVSRATIASDWKAIKSEWKKHYADAADRHLYIQLRRLDVLLNAVWSDARGAVDSTDPAAKPPTWQQRNAAQERALAILNTINKLLGLDQLPGGTADKPLFITTVEVRGLPDVPPSE